MNWSDIRGPDQFTESAVWEPRGAAKPKYVYIRLFVARAYPMQIHACPCRSVQVRARSSLLIRREHLQFHNSILVGRPHPPLQTLPEGCQSVILNVVHIAPDGVQESSVLLARGSRPGCFRPGDSGDGVLQAAFGPCSLRAMSQHSSDLHCSGQPLLSGISSITGRVYRIRDVK